MNGPTFAPAVPTSPMTVRTPAPRPAARAANALAKPSDEAAAALRVLTYLRLHWLMILFCGSFLGCGLAYAAWNLLPVKYESYALLQVASSPSYIANNNDPNRGRTEFATYLKTTASLIKSEFVLNSAMNDAKYRISELPTLTTQKDPIKYLDEKVQIHYAEGSEVLRVTLEGDRPDDIRKIVDAVKDAYHREVFQREKQQKQYFKQQVDKARTSLESLMKSKVGASMPLPLPMANGAGGGVPLPLVDPQPVGLPQPGKIIPAAAVVPQELAESEAVLKARATMALNRMFTLETQVLQFPVVIGEKQSEIDSVKKQIELLKSGPPSPDVLAAADKDPAVQAALIHAQKRRDDAKFFEKVAVNPNSDRVARARQEAADAEAQAHAVRDQKALAMEQTRRQGDADKLFAQLDKAERDLRALQERERVNRKLLDDSRKDVAAMPPDAKRAELAALPPKPVADPQATDILAHNAMYDRLTQQQIIVDFELQSPDRVQVLQSASTPSQKDQKKQIIGTIFAGLMGFALIGLGVVGYESSARKVSSLNELKAGVTSSVVGVIPWAPNASTLRNPIRRADVSEAIDKLRSYVVQSWLSRGATTVAITSPVGDEGKAFTAFGLASSLAQAGYKTLLVDFDLRDPSLQTYAGVPNELGVCELLRGETDPREAVVGLTSGLWFLPAGRWSDEARQAAVGGQLESLLKRLKEPFDCVVLHSHALLTAAETVEIARRSEVVLLCTQYRDTRLPLLKRATDRVAAMEIPYSGIVYLGSSSNESLC